jgi:hypothetical protein
MSDCAYVGVGDQSLKVNLLIGEPLTSKNRQLILMVQPIRYEFAVRGMFSLNLFFNGAFFTSRLEQTYAFFTSRLEQTQRIFCFRQSLWTR